MGNTIKALKKDNEMLNEQVIELAQVIIHMKSEYERVVLQYMLTMWQFNKGAKA